MDDQDTSQSLPPETRIREFVITRTIGAGSFSIVYAATHEILGEVVAIKEFLPRDLACRDSENQVRPRPDKVREFEWARDKFLKEATTLIALANPKPHPNLIEVRHAFRENDTVYMCMRYENGISLERYLGEHGILEEEALRKILLPLLDGLEHAHRCNVWHRDIKPSNIMIREDGSPILIDFGAARHEIGCNDPTVIAQVTPAYAAPEQLWSGIEQGPWTDIYSFGATLYCCLTGRPPKGPQHTALVQMREGNYSRAFLEAVDAALEFQIGDRPQSVAEWRVLFDQNTPKAAQPVAATMEPPTVIGHVVPVASPVTQAVNEAAYPEPKRRRVSAQVWVTLVAAISITGFGLTAWLRWSFSPVESLEEKLKHSTSSFPVVPAAEPNPSVISDGITATELEPPPAKVEEVKSTAPIGVEAVSQRQADSSGRTLLRIEDADPVPTSGPGEAPSVPAETKARAEAAFESGLHHTTTAPRGDVLNVVQSMIEYVPCAHLRVSLSPNLGVKLSGYSPRVSELETLRDRLLSDQRITDVDVRSVEIYPRPFCEMILRLEEASDKRLQHAEKPTIRFNKPTRLYKEGEYLALKTTNTNAVGGFLYVDYIDKEGYVVHMLPTPSMPDNYVGPLDTVSIGSDDSEVCDSNFCYQISPPHGKGLIVAIWSETQLWSKPRDEIIEAADAYILALIAAMREDSSSGLGAYKTTYALIESRE